MLKDNKFVYSQAISQAKPGETPIYRCAGYSDSLMTTYDENINSTQDMFREAVKKFPERRFLGRREVLPDGTLAKEFTWETYRQVEELAAALGSGILNLNMTYEKAQFQNYRVRFIAIYGKNTREWILTDIANSLYGFTTMPIYDTLGEEATDHMFNETELSTLFLSTEHVKGIAARSKLGQCRFLQNLVILDEDKLTAEVQAHLNGCQLRLFKFSEVLASGRAKKQPYKTISPNDICFFSYTSGTTGKPKGTMITHRNLVAAVAGAMFSIPIGKDEIMVHLSYLPLAHIFERMLCSFCICYGGQYGIYNGDVLKLKDDLAILKPNIFASVPRLYNKFYDKIKTGVDELTGMKSCLANKALNTKLANEKSDGSCTHWLYDKLVCSKFKEVLGGNVKFMVTASAPLGVDTMKYLKVAFCCPFLQGYGQTEGLGGSFVTDQRDPTHASGHTGGPLPHNEFKLIDVPDMKYFSTDKDEQGKSRPRGEICVRGPAIVPGYYKQPDKTAETIDKDGWLHSGDIGMILPDTLALQVIDRKKNIFKLSQGEYIAPDKLENYFKTTKGVADMFVYGDSFKSCLVGIVVLDEDEIAQISQESGVSASNREAFCNDPKVNKLIMTRLDATAVTMKMKGFEKVRKIWIEPKTFQDHDLVTATFKLKRNVAQDHYKPIVEKLYVGLD